jgi:hypothetical protein
MAEIQPTNGSSTTEDSVAGQEKLKRLKAELFPADTKAQRIARALEALQKAKKPLALDAFSLRYIAQHADLEGS